MIAAPCYRRLLMASVSTFSATRGFGIEMHPPNRRINLTHRSRAFSPIEAPSSPCAWLDGSRFLGTVIEAMWQTDRHSFSTEPVPGV
jgi:hypothetical protein